MAKKSHVVLGGSRRAKDPNGIRIGNVNPKETIHLTIGLVSPKLPDPDDYVGQTLTQKEFTEKFGTRKAVADQVAKILKKYGLKALDVSLATRSMRVSGTAAQIEAAFKPGMVKMRSHHGELYLGRRGTIQIPVELKGMVTGVFGTDQRRVATRKSRAAAPAGHVAPLTPLGPADLEKRYNFPAGDGAGQTIAIAAFGKGFFADDVNAHCDKFGRPTPKVTKVAVADSETFSLEQALGLRPQKLSHVLAHSVEVMMDVQVVAGLCPKANILLYFSNNDQRGWIDLLNEVITAEPKPVALSISMGGAEENLGWSKPGIAAVNERLNIARLLGITTCVSSGDDGTSAGMNDGRAHVEFPSSSPNVLGVGGTMLKQTGSVVKEIPWWEKPGWRSDSGGGASGGGVSALFPRPAWQKVKVKSLNSESIDGRVVPDVAALAGWPWHDLTYLGTDRPDGGTSAAAPLWAALIARINAKLPAAKRQRFLTPLLYQNARGAQPMGKVAMREITSGNNASFPKPGKGYKAKAGHNAVTGWGVPDGKKLLKALEEI